jgi:hypothetical protein
LYFSDVTQLFWVMVMVFNATFISVLLVEEIGRIRRKPLTCHKSLTNFITYCCIEYILSWAGLELTALVVIGTDCIGSGKSNYYTIKTMTTPSIIWEVNSFSLIYFSCVMLNISSLMVECEVPYNNIIL